MEVRRGGSWVRCESPTREQLIVFLMWEVDELIIGQPCDRLACLINSLTPPGSLPRGWILPYWFISILVTDDLNFWGLSYPLARNLMYVRQKANPNVAEIAWNHFQSPLPLPHQTASSRKAQYYTNPFHLFVVFITWNRLSYIQARLTRISPKMVRQFFVGGNFKM